MSKKEKVRYDPAPEVQKIAEDLISKHHQHIIDFSVNVQYWFVNKTSKSKGKDVWGTCKKITGQNAALAKDSEDGEPFFVITLSREIWDILPPEKRIPYVDHYLCQIGAEVKQAKEEADVPQGEVDDQIEQDNPVRLFNKPYDVEEYACIVKRHGLWREEVEDFINAALKAKGEEA
jgi:predicted metallopeptidase